MSSEISSTTSARTTSPASQSVGGGLPPRVQRELARGKCLTERRHSRTMACRLHGRSYQRVMPGETTGEAAMTIENGFSGSKAASVVGISYRQLDYWARTDLIRPSLCDAAGSGSRRLYSYRDLLELRVIKSLLDAGIKLESVRKAFTYLRQQTDTDIAAATLVISGSDVLLCDGEQLIDIVRRGGQGVLNVLAIGGVKLELDNELVLLAKPDAVAKSGAQGV